MVLSIDSYVKVIKYTYVSAIFLARSVAVPSLSFPFAFRICCRDFAFGSNRRINRKSIHQPHELLAGKSACFISSPWPLETAVSQPDIKKYISVASPQKSLDPVPPGAAKKKQRILIQWVKSVFQVYCGSQSINALTQI